MNNANIEIDEHQDEPQVSREYLEQELAEMTQVLEAIRFLKGNQQWLYFWGKVVLPAAESSEAKRDAVLRNKDTSGAAYFQGMVDAFNKGYDLPGLEKRYSQVVQSLSTRINSLT